MIKKKFRWFVNDKHGHAVIWQTPNLPIIGWFVLMIISHLLSEGVVQSGISALSAAFLFTWAYLEITQGKSPFRRALGVVVLIAVIISFFARDN